MSRLFKHPFYYYFQAKSPFSHWYIRNFKVRERIFNCVEQYMMWTKAEFFGDIETAKKILAARTPKEQKALGRQVSGFNRIVWDSMVDDVLFTANKAKFTQHRDLGGLLLAIDAVEFVEASPYDRIYGVRLSANDPRIQNKKDWLGLNKAGRVITRVRNWMYAVKKGKTMNDSHRPEFIIFDLSQVFEASRQQLAHSADANVLLPSIVSNVVNCLEARDDNLSRLDVYAADVVEQFKNDGQSDEDGHIVAGIVKAVGHAVLAEIVNINGYNDNDSFDYEVMRVEKSGEVYLVSRDPVGVKAADVLAKVEDDPEFTTTEDAIKEIIESRKHTFPVGTNTTEEIVNEIATSSIIFPETGEGAGLKERLDQSNVTRLYLNEEHQQAAENHNHQGYYQGRHTPHTPCEVHGESVSPEEQLAKYDQFEQDGKLIIEESNPAAGFRKRTEFDLQKVTQHQQNLKQLNKSAEFTMHHAPVDNLGFGDQIMGDDKGYREVPLSELKPSVYADIIEKDLTDRIKSGQYNGQGNDTEINDVMLERVAASEGKTLEQLVNDTLTNCLNDPKTWIKDDDQ